MFPPIPSLLIGFAEWAGCSEIAVFVILGPTEAVSPGHDASRDQLEHTTDSNFVQSQSALDMGRWKVLIILGFVISGVLATLTSNHLRQDEENAPFPVVINTWAANGFQSAGAKGEYCQRNG